MADTNGNSARKKSAVSARKSTDDVESTGTAKKGAAKKAVVLAKKAAVAKKTAADFADLEKKNSEPSKFKLMYEAVARFLTSVRGELDRVTWPSGKELRISTVVVVVTLLMISLYMAVVDWGLGLIFGTPATGF